MKGRSAPCGILLFRLTGGKTHEFRFKVERNVPGGAVAVFSQVEAGLSGEPLPLALVLRRSSRSGKADPIMSASCSMKPQCGVCPTLGLP